MWHVQPDKILISRWRLNISALYLTIKQGTACGRYSKAWCWCPGRRWIVRGRKDSTAGELNTSNYAFNLFNTNITLFWTYSSACVKSSAVPNWNFSLLVKSAWNKWKCPKCNKQIQPIGLVPKRKKSPPHLHDGSSWLLVEQEDHRADRLCQE